MMAMEYPKVVIKAANQELLGRGTITSHRVPLTTLRGLFARSRPRRVKIMKVAGDGIIPNAPLVAQMAGDLTENVSRLNVN